MSSLKATDIEIVGFNGAPLVECGRSLPVAKRKADGAYCVLDLGRGIGSILWHTPAEAAEFANARRWTELVKPVTVPNTCIDSESKTITSQPIVIFENETLLDVADRIPRPDHHDSQYLQWQHLKGTNPDYFAACVSETCAEAMLDDWATGLLKRFDATIGAGRDRADMKRIADFALCAARSRVLRWDAFLRYAAVQDPGKVKTTFDRFISSEFPQVTWDSFIATLNTLRDVWGAQPVFRQEAHAGSSSASTASKVKGIAQAENPNLVRP